MPVLFPHEVFASRTVDAHFAEEREACHALGIETGLFDHDARATVGRALQGTAAVRGWMLSVDGYEALEASAAARGTTLATSSAQYARAHYFSGWYAIFRELTPVSVTAPSVDELVEVATRLPEGPGVVKDQVKSLKHLWATHAYVPEVHDSDAVQRIASAFVDERGDQIQGDLVLRAFEPLRGPEARTWWRDGRHVLTTPHPDTSSELPANVPHSTAAAAVETLGCPFVTVDFAQRADGPWRVVEVGDGSVSDRPRTVRADTFVHATFG